MNQHTDSDPAVEALLRAIGDGDTDAAQKIIADGADIDNKVAKHRKDIPLIAAVESGNVDMLRCLLDAGAFVNRRSDYSPLSQAALEVKSPEMVSLLLAHGADPNTGLFMATVLSHSCHQSWEDPEKEWDHELRRVQVPVDDASFEIARLLLEAGASPDGANNHVPAAPLEGPIMAGDMRMIELLLSHGAKLSVMAVFSAACFCAREAILEPLELILERGWKPNPKKTKTRSPASPLNFAVMRGHLDVIELLIRYKIKLDYIPRDVLHTTYLKRSYDGHCVNVAIQFEQREALRLLLQSGASSAGGVTEEDFREGIYPRPLTLASYRGDLEAVEILLEHGADPNQQSEFVFGSYNSCTGKTPLQVATEAGHQPIVELLRANGALA